MEITFGYQKNLVICSNSELLKRTWSNSKNDEKILIPDLEVLPYDNFSPHSEVSSKRLIALRDLLKKDSITAFSTVPALFQPFFDKVSINTLYVEFKENQKIDRNELISNLVENGYDSADLVTKPSSYALRGSVVDIFPSNSKYPVRIDLDDDLISSISIFDTDTQKTLRKINSFIVRPSRGFVLNVNSIKIFKKNWRSKFKEDGEVFESVSKGKFISGIEFYSSLFYDEKPSLKDYLNDFNIFIVGEVKSESKNYWELINNRYEEFLGDVNRPILKPAEIFNSLDEINNLISESETVDLPKKSLDKSLDSVFKDSSSSSEQLERDFDSLLNFKKDELVVHANHGIGKFLGLKNLNNTECFLIEYQNNELLYVPVDSYISNYSLHWRKRYPFRFLSKKKWSEKSQKSKLKAFDIASEILEAEAKRNLEESQKVSLDVSEYEKFCDTFKFTETPDQERVIREVIADLLSDKPQDRLICGEVGFGKTEVALRASFIVAQNNYQVCILAPTTVSLNNILRYLKIDLVNFLIEFAFSQESKQKQKKLKYIRKLKKIISQL
jgi:transcription-repair coupling factor (superfamily II helicase)